MPSLPTSPPETAMSDRCRAALAGERRCPLTHGHEGSHVPGFATAGGLPPVGHPSWAVAADRCLSIAAVLQGDVYPECPTDPKCCPVCGDPSDYCRGHGEIGDPHGAELLHRHDNGDHVWCAEITDY